MIVKIESNDPEINGAYIDTIRHKGTMIEITPGWISVKDKLPEEGVYVLVWETQGFAYCDMLKSGVWNIGANNGAIISHWMPLPEPPKEETHNGNTRND